MPLTLTLIAANVAISVLAWTFDDVFLALMFVVEPIKQGEIYRLVTSAFLHADFMHILFNMMTLFFFGPVLEDERTLGKAGFLILYFLSLLGGNLWALYVNWGDPYYAAVGASGGVSGVLAGISLFAPFLTILIFGIIPMPAILYAVLFIGFSAFAMGSGAFGISHEAHLGGAVTGILVVLVMRPKALPNMIAQIKYKLGNRRR